MVADSGVALGELRVDGGMAANELLMQFQADILDAPVVRPAHLETTALGAAYAAGLAVGYWKSPERHRRHWRADRRWTPADAAGPTAPHARKLGKAPCSGRCSATREKAVEKSLGWKE